MKNLTNLMAMLMVIVAFAACKKTDAAADGTNDVVEETVKAADEAVAKLASYEYVCEHCQKGSHEAGKCACGMDMTKNANFVQAAADKVEGTVSDAKDAVEGVASDAKDAVEGAASDAKDAVEGAASDAKDAVEGAASDAKDAVEGAASDAKGAVDAAKEKM